MSNYQSTTTLATGTPDVVVMATTNAINVTFSAVYYQNVSGSISRAGSDYYIVRSAGVSGGTTLLSYALRDQAPPMSATLKYGATITGTQTLLVADITDLPAPFYLLPGSALRSTPRFGGGTSYSSFFDIGIDEMRISLGA